MIEVIANANTTEVGLAQMQHYIGGDITERCGHFKLTLNNAISKGHKRYNI